MSAWVVLLLAALSATRLRSARAEGEEPLPSYLVELVSSSSISSIEDLQLLLETDSVEEAEEDETEVNANYTHGRFTRSLVDAQPAQQAVCKVRTEVMEVTRAMLDRRNANFLLWPPCVEVQRCSGCCNHRLQMCVPSHTQTRYLQVTKIQYINRRAHYEKAVISVEDHVACRCQSASSSSSSPSAAVQPPPPPPQPALPPAPPKTHTKEDLHRHDALKHNQRYHLEEREQLERQWQNRYSNQHHALQPATRPSWDGGRGDQVAFGGGGGGGGEGAGTLLLRDEATPVGGSGGVEGAGGRAEEDALRQQQIRQQQQQQQQLEQQQHYERQQQQLQQQQQQQYEQQQRQYQQQQYQQQQYQQQQYQQQQYQQQHRYQADSAGTLTGTTPEPTANKEKEQDQVFTEQPGPKDSLADEASGRMQADTGIGHREMAEEQHGSMESSNGKGRDSEQATQGLSSSLVVEEHLLEAIQGEGEGQSERVIQPQSERPHHDDQYRRKHHHHHQPDTTTQAAVVSTAPPTSPRPPSTPSLPGTPRQTPSPSRTPGPRPFRPAAPPQRRRRRKHRGRISKSALRAMIM